LKGIKKYSFQFFSGAVLIFIYFVSQGKELNHWQQFDFDYTNELASDTTKEDSIIKLRYPIKNNIFDPGSKSKSHSLDLNNPSGTTRHLELDSTNTRFRIYNSFNGYRLGDDKYYSISDYLREDWTNFQREYFRERSKSQSFVQDSRLIPPIQL
jgi:hypothetical protein